MGQGIDLLGSTTRIWPERPPPFIDGARLETLLLIKLSSIGDVVHALPTAIAIKRAFPSLRITWAIEEWTAPLVLDHPAVDRVVVFPTLVAWPSRPASWARQLRAAIRELQSERYDVAVDLQGLARSAAISLLSGAPLKIARAGQREGAHLVSRGVRLSPARLHAVDEYLQVAAAIGAAPAPPIFGLRPSPAAVLSVDRLLARHGVTRSAPLIVVNASASQRWKHWRPDRWVRVVSALRRQGTVALIGTQRNTVDRAQLAGDAGPGVVDLTGRTTLAEVIALLDRSSLHLAADTGTVHIAAALGTPVIAVYGPTAPWRVGPYGQPSGVVYGGDSCGRGCPAYCIRQRRCLDAVDVGMVLERAELVLAAARSRMAAVPS
jgi:heptosyltransferase-1